MATGASGCSDSQEIIRIAENAIEMITQLTNIVGRSNPMSTSSSNSGSSHSANAAEELHWRFPTAGSRGRNNTRDTSGHWRSRSAPYPSQRAVGRPLESLTVSRDVVVIDYGQDRVPSKAEKAKLEKSKRVISGFEVNRDWTAKQLERELVALLKGTGMEGFSFEIIKNCSGTLVTPNIPSGRKIDSKLLLKSIAPTGCIYIRLLADLPDESDDMLTYSVFSIPESQTTTRLATTSTSSSSTSSSTSMTAAAITVDLTDAGSAGKTEASVNPVATSTSNHQGHSIQCPFDINSIINTAKSQNLHDCRTIKVPSRKDCQWKKT